jgi:hypothetical protein
MDKKINHGQKNASWSVVRGPWSSPNGVGGMPIHFVAFFNVVNAPK